MMKFRRGLPRTNCAMTSVAVHRNMRYCRLMACLMAAALALLASAAGPRDALAQADTASRPAASAAVPGFWDPRRRPERPDISRLGVVRFMTEVDFPPFNFAGPDGNPAGFNVDLARLICEELKVNCTV